MPMTRKTTATIEATIQITNGISSAAARPGFGFWRVALMVAPQGRGRSHVPRVGPSCPLPALRWRPSGPGPRAERSGSGGHGLETGDQVGDPGVGDDEGEADVAGARRAV